jgi:formylglycine-generating enzyme required for sulfatase activity
MAVRGRWPFGYRLPLGNDWGGGFVNTYESGLSGTTAVGMYPAGAAACGAFDMSGNVWEWTLTELATAKAMTVPRKSAGWCEAAARVVAQDSRRSFRCARGVHE